MWHLTVMCGVLLFSLMLSACATDPDKGDEAEESEPKPEAPQKIAVAFATQPPGGAVRLPKVGRTVERGETVKLEPGEYEVRATRHGYRPVETSVDIEEGRESPVVIKFGEGFGTLTLERSTANAKVTLAGPNDRRDIVFDQGATRSLTLDAGDYALVAERAGFHPLRESIRIEPGAEIEREIALREKPRTTPLTVATDPAGAEIQLNGKVKGQAEIDLGRLPFGEHELVAVHPVDERHRITTTRRVELSRREPRRVTLELDRNERLFEGEWLAAAEATQREEARYRRERVDNPGAVGLELDSPAYEALTATTRLPQKLQSWLRVGDRITFRHADGAVTFWKRHGEITPDLMEAAEALRKGKSHAPEFAADPVMFQQRGEASEAPLWQAIYRLHRGRAEHALLDLRGEQLLAEGSQVPRSRGDGSLTLLARSHDDVRLNDTPVQPAGGIAVARIDPGDEPIQLRWQQPPKYVLVMSDRPATGVKQPDGGFLKLGEKKLVRLMQGSRVKRMERLSTGPAYDGEWQRKSLDRSGPMGDEIDLSRDELGPHQQPGDYRRIWLLHFADANGLSQRQVEVAYSARRQEAKFTTDNFLRHGQDATEPR